MRDRICSLLSLIGGQSVKASLDTALGVALIPYFSPKHHPRATRLLNSVLKIQPSNYVARFARAQIYQAAGNWTEARKIFQALLDAGQDQKDTIAAKEEVGWCLVNEDKLEEGRDMLEEVVEMRDGRWEQKGKDDEALPRARAWWRLGRTEWMIGGKRYETKSHTELTREQTKRADSTPKNGSWPPFVPFHPLRQLTQLSEYATL